MSTEAAPCRTLGEYIAELVARLAHTDGEAFEELRSTVGGRSAHIRLDDEVVAVRFEDRTLILAPPGGRPDGVGATNGGCVLDLLDGYDEVSSAVLDGRLQVHGGLEDVTAIFAAIEIILDVAARSPALQSLARDLRADPCRPGRPPRLPRDMPRSTPWRPGSVDEDERHLLARLDLLPDDG